MERTAVIQTWAIGGASVTRVEEQVGPNDAAAGQFLPDLVRERFEKHLPWLVPLHYDPARDRLITSCHSWLVRIGGRNILLDTCGGNHKERPWLPRFHQQDTPYLQRLEAAGVTPEQIDIVLCTHLHADHVGWNTRLENGRWVPTFPNARYLYSRLEDERWNPELGDRRARNPDRARVYDDSLLPVIAAGQAVLIETEHKIDEQLMVRPAPGHTPGQVLLDLRDGPDAAIFCGDVIHHPVQVYEPSWNNRADEQPEVARATRRQVLEHCAGSGALLFPTHFAAPHVVAIARDGHGFAPKFVSPNA
jgi:glyoxylase-like metal-dependent hydrolase (beta-lactamase superfamily II)